MNKDKALEELFLDNQPQFDDKDAFMASLTKRLDAVEYIKQHQEASMRRYKMAIVAALVVGIVSGAISMAFVLSSPIDVPLFSFFDVESDMADNHILSSLMLWLGANSRLITMGLISILMTAGIYSIFNNIQEIRAMHSFLRQSTK